MLMYIYRVLNNQRQRLYLAPTEGRRADLAYLASAVEHLRACGEVKDNKRLFLIHYRKLDSEEIEVLFREVAPKIGVGNIEPILETLRGLPKSGRAESEALLWARWKLECYQVLMRKSPEKLTTWDGHMARLALRYK